MTIPRKTPVRKMSLKREALVKASGKIPFSTILGERKPVKKNARKPSEFARIYGSKQRVAWVKSLDCIARGSHCGGTIDNHHVITGGTGRKADAKFIVPLCETHHRELHLIGRHTFEKDYGLYLLAEAADVAAVWSQLQDCAGRGEGGRDR